MATIVSSHTIRLGLAILFLCIASFPAVAAEKIFNAKTTVLDNGLQIVVIENDRVPVVTHMVWYRTGAADEPMGTSGIAHFLEHLMFKGSGDLAPGEFSKTIRSLGGNDNAFTSQDYTAFFQSIPSEHLKKAMSMEAGRMRGLAPPSKDVISERKVILEERSQRTDNSPRAKLYESLIAALFPNHPYGIPVIGWQHEMESLSWADAKTFYDHWYAPNNAILVVSGDVKASEVFALAAETYGKVERIDLTPRSRTTTPPLPGKYTISYSDPAVQQPVFQRIYRVPSLRQNKEASYALEVLQDIFGAGATARLYKSLVIEQKLATNAGLSYSPNSWDDSMMFLYASPAPGVDMSALELALDKEIEELARNGVSEEELSSAIKRMQAEAIYARDSLTGPAMIFGYTLITGATLDDVEFWPNKISAVTAEKIQTLAQDYLIPSGAHARYVTGYLMPQTTEDDNTPSIDNEETE